MNAIVIGLEYRGEIWDVGFIRYSMFNDELKCSFRDINSIVYTVSSIVGDYPTFCILGDRIGQPNPSAKSLLYVNGGNKEKILVEEIVKFICFLANPMDYCE